MKALLEGNAYKYWINGGIDVRLHLTDEDIDIPDAVTVTPNDISWDVTYANKALRILWCCGDGSVELHYHVEDGIDAYWTCKPAKQTGCEILWDEDGHTMTFIPPASIDEREFRHLLYELYDIEAFEEWDGDTNTGQVNLD